MATPQPGATSSRPFRFGVGPGGIRADSIDTWTAMACRLEALGYSVLSVGDHVGFMGPIAATMAAAAATTTLRVGSMTFCNDFRHPLLLAQEVATIDRLSGGRTELAIGAGWAPGDYRTLGLPMDRPGVRIERMAEAVTIIKRYFTGEEFSFRGEHYTVTDARGRPAASQHPRPPLVIGGGGPRVLTLAAQEADIISVNAVLRTGDIVTDRGSSATGADTRAKFALIADVAGDRLSAVELGVYVHICEVTDAAGVDGAATTVAGQMNMSVDDAMASPHALVGTPDQIAAKLQRQRDELGVSYLSIDAVSVEAMAPVVARLAGT